LGKCLPTVILGQTEIDIFGQALPEKKITVQNKFLCKKTDLYCSQFQFNCVIRQNILTVVQKN
jgi:hypothetical protein